MNVPYDPYGSYAHEDLARKWEAAWWLPMSTRTSPDGESIGTIGDIGVETARSLPMSPMVAYADKSPAK
jgi:hypothetical protein